jgi:hypothetical protein
LKLRSALIPHPSQKGLDIHGVDKRNWRRMPNNGGHVSTPGGCSSNEGGNHAYDPFETFRADFISKRTLIATSSSRDKLGV